jgi:hypothetical protein
MTGHGRATIQPRHGAVPDVEATGRSCIWTSHIPRIDISQPDRQCMPRRIARLGTIISSTSVMIVRRRILDNSSRPKLDPGADRGRHGAAHRANGCAERDQSTRDFATYPSGARRGTSRSSVLGLAGDSRTVQGSIAFARRHVASTSATRGRGKLSYTRDWA